MSDQSKTLRYIIAFTGDTTKQFGLPADVHDRGRRFKKMVASFWTQYNTKSGGEPQKSHWVDFLNKLKEPQDAAKAHLEVKRMDSAACSLLKGTDENILSNLSLALSVIQAKYEYEEQGTKALRDSGDDNYCLISDVLEIETFLKPILPPMAYSFASERGKLKDTKAVQFEDTDVLSLTEKYLALSHSDRWAIDEVAEGSEPLEKEAVDEENDKLSDFVLLNLNSCQTDNEDVTPSVS